MTVKLDHSNDRVQNRRFRGRAAGLLVLFLGVICLGLMTTHEWQALNESSQFLNASLLARSTADYRSSWSGTPMVQVGLGIIRDMIKDSNPDPTDLQNRLATITGMMLSPVPSQTALPGFPNSHAPTATRAMPVLTATPIYTSTLTQVMTLTATAQMPTLTSSPYPSSTPIPTYVPTSTQQPRITKTPRPQKTKKPGHK
jgi:hypothetical protein